ncbi:MAG: hypothetical protein P8X91_04710 [Candidatus Bathyarchaeota archaeon]
MENKKHSLKNKDISQQDVDEKSCIVRRNEKEYNKLNKKIEEKIKKLNEFAEQKNE